MVQFVDLSVTLRPGASEAVPVTIDYLDHRAGGTHLAELINVPVDSLPGCLAWASERVSAITHSGTHVDAPYHYSPFCNGARSRTIDEMPLDWFFGPAAVIDGRGHTSDEPITVDEILAASDGGKQLQGCRIVLFLTGAVYGSSSYMRQGRGVASAAVEYLCDLGVRLIGTDAWSLDPPLEVMSRQAGQAGHELIWEAHYTGRYREFCIVEKLQNLDRLPARGFTVACFPVKVGAGSAGWTRAVAMFPEAQ